MRRAAPAIIADGIAVQLRLAHFAQLVAVLNVAHSTAMAHDAHKVASAQAAGKVATETDAPTAARGSAAPQMPTVSDPLVPPTIALPFRSVDILCCRRVQTVRVQTVWRWDRLKMTILVGVRI